MQVLNYFLRRLLLIIPTFIGATLIVFAVTRFVPGGPVEQAIMARQLSMAEGGKGSVRSTQDSQPLGEKQLEQLKQYYGFDKPWYISYVTWLGKILQGDLGRSTKYSDPVGKMIVEKIPISLRFGIVSTLLIYLICIPLGVKKALTHGKPFDNISSVVVFVGYAIPSYIVAIILFSVFAARLGWFPMGGYQSMDMIRNDMNALQKLWDSIRHMFLPMLAYVLGGFATLTIAMKNLLMENMASDYIKTAVAKGRTFKDAMWLHAFRNSVIPIAAGLGGLIGLFLSGSFLIEQIFNIRGMGLLGYTSLMDRDYPVVMGTLVITTLITLIGNILSDFILSMVDPRIRLGK